MNDNSLNYIAKTFTRLEKLTAEGKYPTISAINEPTFLEYIPIFHFNAPGGLLADESNKNSALAFLKRVGETARYDSLKRMHELLYEISTNCPWMIKEIAGLGHAFAPRVYASEENTEQQLTLSFYETLDWRVQAMFDSYLHATYDDNRGVEILPVNLRRFTMSVYIRDVRILMDYDELVSKYFGDTRFSTDAVAMQSVNHKMVYLGRCEFHKDSLVDTFDNWNDKDYSELTISLKLKYDNWSVSNKYRALFGNTVVSTNTETITKTEDALQTTTEAKSPNVSYVAEQYSKQLKDLENQARSLSDTAAAKQRLQAIAEDATGSAMNIVGSKALGLINDSVKMYNVYELEPSTYFSLLQATSVEDLTI